MNRLRHFFGAVRRRWRHLKRWQKVVAGLGLFLLAGLFALYLWIFSDLPSIDRLQAGMALPSTRLYDRNGHLLYEIIDPQGGRNTAISLDQVPKTLIEATIATEDRNFYSTPGVDPEGILRALWIDLQGGEIKAGGSTITQQVVRNLLLDPEQRAERTLRRKLREMAMAIQLAQRYSHDEVLSFYLNQTYYGNLAYGVQAAAQVYFHKDVSALTLAESAMLAGLPQSPGIYDPLTNPGQAKDRQRVVLDLMVVAGYLTQEQADQAFKDPLQYGSGQFEMEAPHFVQEVWKQIEHDYPQQVYEGGLEVTTTLDLDWQRAAETIAKRHLVELNTPTADAPAHNASGAALVAIDPATGQVLTMLGSVDYFDKAIDGAVNMAVAPRQPGSALKPFTYSLAFDPAQKKPWTPATMILDVSTPFVTRRLESYTPANYGLVEHGPVLIREALASSYNIPAVITLDHVGVDSLVNLLHKLGVTTLQNPDQIGLAVTLGGGEVRLNELTAAYAAFATGGRPIQTSLILEVKDKHGTVLYRWQPPAQQAVVIDPRVVWLISNILSDNNARIPAFGTHSPLAIGRPAAVKTGTTTDFRDNWTVGFTPQVVVGVWVGNANNTPMIDVSGVSGAGPIWNEFMRTVLQDKPELGFERPPGLVQAEVCAISGLLPTPYCPKTRLDWFIEGTVPTTPDDMYQPFTVDRRTGLLATDQTPLEDKIQQVFMVLPQEARTWGLRHGVKPPPVSPEQVARKDDVLRLLSPDPYTVFQLSPVLPFDAQRVRFSVGVAPGTARVEYWLNGKLFEAVQSDPWLAWWPLTPGQYTLQAKATLRDGSTQESDPIRFTVASYVPPEERPSSGEVH